MVVLVMDITDGSVCQMVVFVIDITDGSVYDRYSRW